MDSLLSFIVGITSSIVAVLIIKFIVNKYNARLNFKGVIKNITIIYEKMQKDSFSPDYILAIDRNACIMGSILAGYVGLNPIIVIATKTTRKPFPSGVREVFIQKQLIPLPEEFEGKKILILTAFNDTGDTLRLVFEYFNSHKCKASEIRTAALFTTISPTMKPTYHAKEIGTDIKMPMNKIISRMPWMSEQWRHVLAEERITTKI